VTSHARSLPQRPILVGASTMLIAVAVLIPAYRLQDLPWLHAIATASAFVLTCVAPALGVWWISMRSGGPASWPRALSLHAVAAVAFSATWTLAFSSLIHLMRPERMLLEDDAAIWQFVWGLVIYGGLVQAARTRQRLKEREEAAAGAELQALRAQLDPHFLFNTIHSLTQLAREDPVATQEALERFGDLMRYVLRAGRDPASEASLEDELEFVRNYLAVERLRLGERLRVLEDIDSEALELALPPLLLQPLVENAVRHGIAPRRSGGVIRLAALAADGRLTIEVADDGRGADPDAWRRSEGLGLKAIRRQLRARFPGSHDLQISTGLQAGFRVRLVLPMRLPARRPS
jgi:hypothetical protein